MWFQQDEATAYTARTFTNLLREPFLGRLISLRDDPQWPARLPDLALRQYFLWGYLKTLVYTNHPKTLSQLKDNIRVSIAYIGTDMLKKIRQIFQNSFILVY